MFVGSFEIAKYQYSRWIQVFQENGSIKHLSLSKQLVEYQVSRSQNCFKMKIIGNKRVWNQIQIMKMFANYFLTSWV